MRILLVTHGLPIDEVALRFGAQLARDASEPPTIVVVVSSARHRPRAEVDLDRAREILSDVPHVETRIRVGAAVQGVADEAREGGFELIVAAEWQETGPLARWRKVSRSVRLVEVAPCPVVIVKGIVRPIQRILLCDSGANGPLADPLLIWKKSSPSLLARFTAQLARMLSGEEEVTILHVMSQIGAGPGVVGRQLRADAQELIEGHTPEGELLREDIQVLGGPGIQALPKVRHGLVLDEIMAEVQTGDYDLLVIGAHRSDPWQRLLLDDLARKIIVYSDRPVLIVK